jgi:hypothetical protein
VNLRKSPAPEAVIELSAPISYLEWVTVLPNPGAPVPEAAPQSRQNRSRSGSLSDRPNTDRPNTDRPNTDRSNTESSGSATTSNP